MNRLGRDIQIVVRKPSHSRTTGRTSVVFALNYGDTLLNLLNPTDSKLLETSRDKLVEAARANGIALKQTFEREGKHLTHKASRYGHAKQYRRMRKVIKRQGTIVGRLSREIARKANVLSEAVQEALMQPLGRANRTQEPPMSLVPRWVLP